jgi:hypothetical protein
MSTPARRAQLQAALGRLRSHWRDANQVRRHRLQVAAGRLRARILEAFERDELPRFRVLDAILSQGRGLPVPTLSVCGHGTAEERFTRLLAFFLDHRPPHGLGGRLARAVFAPEFPGDGAMPFERCEACAEVHLGRAATRSGVDMENFVDLWLRVGGHHILVEQKILSGEGTDQLARYRHAASAQASPEALSFFFLTPDGRPGKDELWRPLSYRDLLSRMASVLEDPDLSAVARHNLRSLLWDLMVGPVARDLRWLHELRAQVRAVVQDCNRYADLARWLARYGMGADERRVLLQLVEN